MDYNTFKIERALKVQRDKQFKMAGGKAYRNQSVKGIGKHGWKEKQSKPSDIIRELYIDGKCILKETIKPLSKGKVTW